MFSNRRKTWTKKENHFCNAIILEKKTTKNRFSKNIVIVQHVYASYLLTPTLSTVCLYNIIVSNKHPSKYLCYTFNLENKGNKKFPTFSSLFAMC